MSKKAISVSVPHGEYFDAIYPGVSQMVAIGAASAQSAALGASTSVVQLCATVDCFVAIGSNPTAIANTSCYLPAGTPVRLGCNPGDKVAVIEASGAGSLYITEGA